MTPLSLLTSPAETVSRVDLAPRRGGDDARRADADSAITRSPDTVEFSSQARSIAANDQESPVRTDLVQRVKAEIKAGTYDSPEKYLVALSRALGDTDSAAG